MPYALDNVTVDNPQYTREAELRCPGAVRLLVTVANAAVYYSYTIRDSGVSGGLAYRQESLLLPGMYTRSRPTESVRFRAADPTAELPAQVIVEAITADEVSSYG